MPSYVTPPCPCSYTTYKMLTDALAAAIINLDEAAYMAHEDERESLERDLSLAAVKCRWALSAAGIGQPS